MQESRGGEMLPSSLKLYHSEYKSDADEIAPSCFSLQAPSLPQGLCKDKVTSIGGFTFPEVTGRKVLLPSSKLQTFFISIAQVVKFPPSPLCIVCTHFLKPKSTLC